MRDFSDEINIHPSYSARAHRSVFRIHLPVAPDCSAECAFCTRGSGSNTIAAPGVTQRVLNPRDATVTLTKIVSRLSAPVVVVGTAGPGDALASDHAVVVFESIPEMVDSHGPRVLKCISTNGLELERRAVELSRAGVSFITVSMHSVNASTIERLVPRVLLHGEWRGGVSAARELVERQLRGIKKASNLGMLVKVNMVLVKDVDLGEVTELASAVKEAGAVLLNPIPIIPSQGSSLLPPTTLELEQA